MRGWGDLRVVESPIGPMSWTIGLRLTAPDWAIATSAESSRVLRWLLPVRIAKVGVAGSNPVVRSRTCWTQAPRGEPVPRPLHNGRERRTRRDRDISDSPPRTCLFSSGRGLVWPIRAREHLQASPRRSRFRRRGRAACRLRSHQHRWARRRVRVRLQPRRDAPPRPRADLRPRRRSHGPSRRAAVRPRPPGPGQDARRRRVAGG